MVCSSLAPARASMPSSRGFESSRLYTCVESVLIVSIVRTFRSSRTLRSIANFRSTGSKFALSPDDVFPYVFYNVESSTCSIALQNVSLIFWCCLHLFHCPSEYLAGFLLALRAGGRVMMPISLGL